MTAEPRRAVPVKVQLAVAKRQLAELMRAKGFEVERLELDHDPALARRNIDPDTGEHIPHQHDAAYLVWRPAGEHAVKTRGSGATTRGSDIGEITHERHVTASEAEFRARILSRQAGDKRVPKGTIRSQGFRPAPPQRSASRPIDRTRP